MTGRAAAASVAFDLGRAIDALKRGKPNTALALIELAHADAVRLEQQLVGDSLEVGDLLVDVPGRRALLAGEELHLAGRVFDLLAVLASEPARAWPRQLLYQRIWGADLSRSSRSLDSAAQRLRCALGPSWVQSVRGVGYRLTARTPEPPVTVGAELVGSAL